MIDLHAQRFEDAREGTVLRPVVEPILDALPGPESLRQITPGNSSLASVEYCFNKLSVAEFRLRTVSLLRKDRPQSLPLFVAQRVSVHRDF